MKIVKQYRFFEDRSKIEDDLEDLAGTNDKNISIDESLLFFQSKNIIQLGIQALPGTKFFLNQSDDQPAVVGVTGIFEIPIDSNVQIEKIRFDLSSLEIICNNISTYIIIDTIEEDTEG